MEYLKSLHAAYESFITEIAKIIPVIKVDYSRFRTAEEMATAIKKEYEDIANIRHVKWSGGSTTPANTAEEERVARSKSATPDSPTASIEELLAGASLISQELIEAETSIATPVKDEKVMQQATSAQKTLDFDAATPPTIPA